MADLIDLEGRRRRYQAFTQISPPDVRVVLSTSYDHGYIEGATAMRALCTARYNAAFAIGALLGIMLTVIYFRVVGSIP